MIKCTNELRQIALRGYTLVTENWVEIQEVASIRASHYGGYDNMRILMVSMHEEDADGNFVHDVYESNIDYYSDDDDDLTLQDFIHRAVDNEKHIKEYKRMKSLMNFIDKQRLEGSYDAILIH